MEVVKDLSNIIARKDKEIKWLWFRAEVGGDENVLQRLETTPFSFGAPPRPRSPEPLKIIQCSLCTAWEQGGSSIPIEVEG